MAVLFSGETVALTVLPRMVEPDAVISDASRRMLVAILLVELTLGLVLGIAVSAGMPLVGRLVSPLRKIPIEQAVHRGMAIVLAGMLWLNAVVAVLPSVASVLALLLVPLGLSLTVLGVGRFRALRPALSAWSVTVFATTAPLLALKAEVPFAVQVVVLTVYGLGVAALYSALQRWLLSVRDDAVWFARKATKTSSFAALTALIGFLFVLDGPTAFAFPARSEHVKQQRPNVVMLVLDTVRSDHMSLFGYERDTTPFLRELSKTAVTYPKHHGTADLTLPGHASIYTGQFPSAHQAYPHVEEGKLYATPLSNSHTTMAEYLKEAGYNTAGIVANHGFLGPGFGLLQGFDRYSARVPVPLLPGVGYYYLRSQVRPVLDMFIGSADFDMLYRRADEINADVLATLGNLVESERPFFLLANYMDAHDPYNPPAPFNTRYPGRVLGYHFDEFREAADDVLSLRRDFHDWELDHIVSQYDGGIAYLDHAVAQVVEQLKAHGVYDNTLLVITSDHGEAFGEHHFAIHGCGSVYEDQVRVPLIIKYPGLEKGERFPFPVSQVDILPTVLDEVGLPIPSDAQGVSLRSTEARTLRPLLAEAAPEREPYELTERLRETRHAVFYGDRKFIMPSKSAPELYDLARDPMELNNLYEPGDSLAVELELRMRDVLGNAPRENDAPVGEVDQAAIERLRALGYAR